MSAAFWPVATRPTSALPRRAGIVVITAVGAAAGVGAALGVLRATAQSVGATSGAGVASGVMSAPSRAVGAAAGLGATNPVFKANANMVAASAGHGNLSATIYGFYSDAEVAIVMEEMRVTYADARGFFDVDVVAVAEEPRTAFIEFEARVMVVEAKQTAEIGAEPRTAGLPNRLRKT